MPRKILHLAVAVVLLLVSQVICSASEQTASEQTSSEQTAVSTQSRPNVIVVLADDLGFGDTSCYGAKVHQTPNIDRLAASGIRFVQGYATSATCTPSRYALITGIYPIRHPKASILPGDAEMIIKPGTITLPQMFRNAGYRTGFVGKWHLGLGKGKINWNEEICPGMDSIGFDESFHMAATNDRTPTVFIHNGRVANLDPADPLLVDYQKNIGNEPTYISNPELVTKQKSLYGHNNSVHNGVGRIGFQKGGTAARWVDEDMADLFKAKSEEFIRQSAVAGKPFFLYYALHQPHVPRMPNPRFVGKSPLGPRGDVIIEADWQVGQLIDLLAELKIDKNTVVIFTSDNGPVLNDGYLDQSIVNNNQTGHTPSGPLRGGKYSRYDGGMHVPMIISWPGTIQHQTIESDNNSNGRTSNALICQMDFLASLAALIGSDDCDEIARTTDSQNQLDALLGNAEAEKTEAGKAGAGRKDLLLEASKKLSLRSGKWFLVPNIGKGESPKTVNAELFDLENDPGQTKNVANEHPEIVARMTKRIKEITEQE